MLAVSVSVFSTESGQKSAAIRGDKDCARSTVYQGWREVESGSFRVGIWSATRRPPEAPPIVTFARHLQNDCSV
jgi:hypothetical protein